MRQHTANMTSQPGAAPRRSAKAAAGKRPPAPQRLSDELFREADPLDASAMEPVGAEPPWDSFDLPEEADEAVGSEAFELRERSVPEDDLSEAEEDEDATEAENLVLRYLQEA